MGDGEIKIHVSADGELQKIEDAQKRIAELHRAANAYESKGMDTAARSARAEARPLEREVARFTKERASDAKRITQEMREQDALQKAGVGRRISPSRMAQAVGAGEQLLSGGDPSRTASSMLVNAGMSSGNPAIIVGAIAAALATTLAGVMAKEQDKDTSERLRFDESRANESFASRRQWGVFGGSSALKGDALSAEEEVAKRTAAAPGLQEKARQKWYDPSTWEWGGLRKNEGHREAEVNEQERMAAQTRAASKEKLAAARYEQTDGGLELDALRGRAKRSLSGQRQVAVDEMAKKAFAKYEEAKRQGATDDMAGEMSNLTYKNELRDRQASAGSGLVDARSGGAGIAAAARWAVQSNPMGSEVGGKLETLIGVVTRGNHDASMEKLHK